MKRFYLFALAVGLCMAGRSLAADNPVVVMDTSMGQIKIELYADKAPKTVANFLKYVDEKFYDGTVFHRVIGKENTPNQHDFMIQGGGFEPGLKEKKAGAPIVNEAGNGVSNAKYTIAMARTSDPNSATAQFFINVADNKFLDRQNNTPRGAGYAVFGKVISGMDVVDKIKAVPTHTVVPGQYENVPVKDVAIKTVRRGKK